MTFDLGRGEIVMFGGGTRVPSAYFNDTWVWSGGSWLQRTPTTLPPARYNQAICYDIVLGKVLMFGGLGTSGPFNETWAWDGTDWSQLFPTNSPSPRHGVAMAYDLWRARAVLYGGTGNTGSTTETWEWDGTNWLQRSPATQPLGLSWHMMSFDFNRGVTVMFGGYLSGVSNASNATYEWDGNDWTQRTTVHTPPGRYSACFAYDEVQRMHVLFGGWDTAVQTRQDTWEYDGTDWAQRTPANSPSPRAYFGNAFDPSSGATVIFAGEDTISSNNGETWLYRNPNPASFSSYGVGCGGSAGNLSLASTGGAPWIGDPVSIELGNLPNGAVPFLLFGFQRAQINLGPFGIPGCTQLLTAAGNILLVASGGVASWNLTLPNDPSLVGVKFQLQGAAFQAGGANPYGFAASAGLEAMIGVH
ncbi:MAG: hypothetical protein KDE27_23705 [Planctomycetes bacterium]|nr:hypothetical protein [Planctomycetota bacterium]